MCNIPNILVDAGICICIHSPRGDHGLESFQLNEKYKFEAMTADIRNKPYMRVYPEGSTSYETCSMGIFKRYFKTEK